MFDHLFSDIQFNDANHTYLHSGRRMNNVTDLVDKLQKPFDSLYWAARKAPELGITPEQVLAKWDEKRIKSQETGIAVHRYIQTVLTGQAASTDDPFLALNKRYYPHQYHFDQLWKELQPQNDVIRVEWVIGDPGLNLAGTADCLLFNQETESYHLFDWKTNEKFSLDNRSQKLLHPFADLDDCKFNVYSLQTSLYRLIIEQAAGVTLGDSYLVHLTGGGYQIYRALDLRDRCELWLPTITA